MLQAQVEPHFLFNTLASVQYLTETDPKQANGLLGHLIAYWRAALPQLRARSSTLGGGASPVRHSTYSDPRVLAAAKVGPGTTRHFPAIEWTINNAMGSEPKLPAWVEISHDVIPVELGKLLAGQYSSPEQCMAAIKGQADTLAAPFRNG